MTRKTPDAPSPDDHGVRVTGPAVEGLMPRADRNLDVASAAPSELQLAPLIPLATVQRRSVLRGGVGAALGSVFGSAMLAACGGGEGAGGDVAAHTDASEQKSLLGTGGESISAAPTAATFAATTLYWTSTGTEQYSSTTGLATYNAIAQLTGSTPASTEAWVEIQYRNNTRAGGMIALDTAPGVPLHTASRYLVQLQPSGLLRSGYDSPSTLSNVGYTFPSPGVNNRVRLHLSATGVVTVQTTVDNGGNWTVRKTFSRNVSTLSSPLYWRLYGQQNHDIYEPRQTGVGTSANAGIPTTFDALYPPGFQLNHDQVFTPRPTLAKPLAKSTGVTNPVFTDPVFGTKGFVLTDPAEIPDSGVGMLRNDYAKRQFYNADETRFIVLAENAWWHLYDATTFAHINVPGGTDGRIPQMSGFNCDCHWHPTDPTKLFYTLNWGGLTWWVLDVTTGVRQVAWTFSGRLPVGFETATRFTLGEEGRPSKDGRYWAFMVLRDDYSMVGLLTYDRVTDQILSHVATTNKPDWVGASNSGQWAIVQFGPGEGQTLTQVQTLPTATARGTRAYPINNLASGWRQLDVYGGHGDVATDAYGDDVWVSASYSPYNESGVEGDLYYRRIHDGLTVVYPGMNVYNGQYSVAMHASGVAYDRPGWAVISYQRPDLVAHSFKDSVIMIIELCTTNARVYRVTDHRFAGTYLSTPLPSPNRSLTRIMYSTDWLAGGGLTDPAVPSLGAPFRQYMIGLPSWALPVAGTTAPVKTANPSISGTASQNGTLTRTLGTYTGLPAATVSGNWQRSTDSGATWANVSGATGATYVIPGATANGVRFRWTEVASSTAGTTPGTSNVLTVAALAAPVNTVAPSAPSSGYTDAAVAGNVGTWTGNPLPTLASVWQRNIGGTWTDSALTTPTATLSPAGTWRLKVSATNSQGGPVIAYSNTVSVAAPAVEPMPSTIITFNQANGTTLEQIASAWEGLSTGFHVQSSALVQVSGWAVDRTWLTTAGGINQAAQVTLKAAADLRVGEHLTVHLHTDASQVGYRLEISTTQLRLFRNGDGPYAGPVSHGVNLLTTDLTLKVTTFAGRIRAYVNGSAVPLIDHTDSNPLSGGYAGFSAYPGGTPSRVKISQFAYGSS